MGFNFQDYFPLNVHLVEIFQKMKGKHSGGKIVFKLDLKLKQSLTFIEGNFVSKLVYKA